MPKTAPKLDPTPSFARQVLDLYVEALSEVRFPDLDLAALQAARDELQVSQVEIDSIEAELARARAQLETQVAALNAKADRALAYARVYAGGGDAALQTRIAEVGKKKVAQLEGASPKRRGRPKVEAATELFDEDRAPEAIAASAGH
jgi:hypothetical protein